MTKALDILRGERILVTGAAGFLGAHAVEALRAVADVHPVTRRDADLADREAVLALFDRIRPARVLHLAGYANGRQGIEHLNPSIQGDLLATVHVLEAAHRAGCCRVVITGSLEEPDAGSPAPSPYALSKRAAADYAELCHRLYGLPVVTARIFMTYGPGQRPDKLIPLMIESFAAGRTFDLRSADRPVDWIHVDDVTDALLLCCALPGLDGRTVDIGSGSLTTIGELAKLVARSMESDTLLRFIPADRANERVRAATITETERLLGWRPAVSLAEGLSQTIAALAPKEAAQ